MKIRFGEFPEHHHFLLITRPFVEGMFKYFGWLVLVSAVHYAQEKSGNRLLLAIEIFLWLLMLAFNGAFIDWVLGFKRNRKSPVTVRMGRGWIAAIFSIFITLVLVGLINVVTDNIIQALVESQKMAK